MPTYGPVLRLSSKGTKVVTKIRYWVDTKEDGKDKKKVRARMEGTFLQADLDSETLLVHTIDNKIATVPFRDVY